MAQDQVQNTLQEMENSDLNNGFINSTQMQQNNNNQYNNSSSQQTGIDFSQQDKNTMASSQQQQDEILQSQINQKSQQEKLTPIDIKKSLGNYTLGKTLGEGTFGKVKLATHNLTGEKVAVKILEKHRIVDVADVERVQREIHILKLLRHPSIVQLYEIIETPKQLFLIMEFASNGELFDYIVKNQRVKEEEAVELFNQIINGVEYIHKLKIVHRDLKPENLLMTQEHKNVKLVDFGLSNTYKQNEKLKTACGSPCYAAPEMIAGQAYNGLGVDIWSCGVILYALICGYLPFEDSNTAKLYEKIQAGNYQIPNFISIEAQDIISKILNTDPQKRFTIEQIRDHPWCKNRKVKNNQGILVGYNRIPIDKQILKESEKLGLNYDYTLKCLEANKHNHVTTVYYLLLKKHIENGGKSCADIGSADFDPSVLQPLKRQARSNTTNSMFSKKNSVYQKYMNLDNQLSKQSNSQNRGNSDGYQKEDFDTINARLGNLVQKQKQENYNVKNIQQQKVNDVRLSQNSNQSKNYAQTSAKNSQTKQQQYPQLPLINNKAYKRDRVNTYQTSGGSSTQNYYSEFYDKTINTRESTNMNNSNKNCTPLFLDKNILRMYNAQSPSPTRDMDMNHNQIISHRLRNNSKQNTQKSKYNPQSNYQHSPYNYAMNLKRNIGQEIKTCANSRKGSIVDCMPSTTQNTKYITMVNRGRSTDKDAYSSNNKQYKILGSQGYTRFIPNNASNTTGKNKQQQEHLNKLYQTNYNAQNIIQQNYNNNNKQQQPQQQQQLKKQNKMANNQKIINNNKGMSPFQKQRYIQQQQRQQFQLQQNQQNFQMNKNFQVNGQHSPVKIKNNNIV